MLLISIKVFFSCPDNWFSISDQCLLTNEDSTEFLFKGFILISLTLKLWLFECCCYFLNFIFRRFSNFKLLNVLLWHSRKFFSIKILIHCFFPFFRFVENIGKKICYGKSEHMHSLMTPSSGLLIKKLRKINKTETLMWPKKTYPNLRTGYHLNFCHISSFFHKFYITLNYLIVSFIFRSSMRSFVKLSDKKVEKNLVTWGR